MRLPRINLAIVLLLPMPALSLNSISPVREEEDIVRHPEKQRPTYGIQTLMRSGKRTISVNRLKIQISFSSWIYLGNYTKESPNRIIGRAYLVMIETVSLFIFLFIFFLSRIGLSSIFIGEIYNRWNRGFFLSIAWIFSQVYLNNEIHQTLVVISISTKKCPFEKAKRKFWDEPHLPLHSRDEYFDPIRDRLALVIASPSADWIHISFDTLVESHSLSRIRPHGISPYSASFRTFSTFLRRPSNYVSFFVLPRERKRPTRSLIDCAYFSAPIALFLLFFLSWIENMGNNASSTFTS